MPRSAENPHVWIEGVPLLSKVHCLMMWFELLRLLFLTWLRSMFLRWLRSMFLTWFELLRLRKLSLVLG